MHAQASAHRIATLTTFIPAFTSGAYTGAKSGNENSLTNIYMMTADTVMLDKNSLLFPKIDPSELEAFFETHLEQLDQDEENASEDDDREEEELEGEELEGEELSAIIQQIFINILNHIPTLSELEYWKKQITSGLKLNDVVSILMDTANKYAVADDSEEELAS